MYKDFVFKKIQSPLVPVATQYIIEIYVTASRFQSLKVIKESVSRQNVLL